MDDRAGIPTEAHLVVIDSSIWGKEVSSKPTSPSHVDFASPWDDLDVTVI